MPPELVTDCALQACSLTALGAEERTKWRVGSVRLQGFKRRVKGPILGSGNRPLRRPAYPRTRMGDADSFFLIGTEPPPGADLCPGGALCERRADLTVDRFPC